MTAVRRLISGTIYALSGAISVLALIYPFLTAATPTGTAATGPQMAHSLDAPLVTAALVGLSLAALLVELQGRTLSAKTVAMLGVLVAITSVLRFIEVAVPLPGGFSPIFAPIILAGYVFGSRFGFLMGALTLLTSALITGGVGPWLPYQMFTAGWTGMTAGWLGRIARPRRRTSNPRRWAVEVLLLCALGLFWGLGYGVIINVYFWPFATGPGEMSWTPGMGLGETLARYGVFYMATSLAWDLTRAGGNVALILFLGAPMVRALARFQRRFHFEAGARA